MTSRRLLSVCLSLAAVGLVAACSSPSVASLPSLPASAAAPIGTSPEQSAAAADLLDPCQALTDADVQPFLVHRIDTDLPTVMNGPEVKGCTWQTSAVNGAQSSVTVLYQVGDAAETLHLLNTQPGSGTVGVPGIGDVANHAHSDWGLVAFHGSGSALASCGITTLGQGLTLQQGMDLTAMIDDQATRIDEQYGTLCNKLFGTGNTTPVIPSVPSSAASAADSSSADSAESLSSPAPNGPALADSGQTLQGTTIPLPAGLDCSGSHYSATNLTGGPDCATTSTDPAGVYAYYLKALPAHGFTINNQSAAASNGTYIARILANGDDQKLVFVSIIKQRVDVSEGN